MAQTKSEGHRSCGIAEGTMVLTKKGYLPIEKIKVGDFVLSHDGKFHKIIHTIVVGNEPVFFLKAPGIFPIFLTENQKLYVQERSIESVPFWMTTDELLGIDLRHYRLGIPINHSSVIPRWDGVPFYIGRAFQGMKCNLDPSDNRLWYLAGRYLGDGWMNKNPKPELFNEAHS